MEREDLREVDLTRLQEGYSSQWELFNDLCAWLDLLLYYHYRHHRWLGPDSELKNMLGLVVSREEFEHMLARSAQVGLSAQVSDEEWDELSLTRQAILLRLERTTAELPLLSLFSRCGLDEFEQNCVILAYAGTVDKKYEKLFAYLQDDMTSRAPGLSLAVQLFLPRGESMEAYLGRFARQDGFLRLFQAEALSRGTLILRDVVAEFLSTGTISHRPGREIFDGAALTARRPMVVHGAIARQLDAVLEDTAQSCVLLTGPAGGGKRFQVEHLMARRQARCVFADLEGEEWRTAAEDAALTALLTDAYLCLYHLDRRDETGDPIPPGGGMMTVLEDLVWGKPVRFFLSQIPIKARLSTLEVEIDIPPLTEEERVKLFWDSLRDLPMDPDCTPEQLAATFRFSPRQIVTACQQAEGLSRLEGEEIISAPLLHRCCYRQVVHKLGDLASRVPAAFTWEDVVLPESQKRLMQQACGHIRHKVQVYSRWGFANKVQYGRGLSILFAGAPGTGKTMCAQVIAKHLNMEMYKINLSQIVSKYIGETEKNLRAVFTEARNANSILFFDECDALFGKRSEVKDSHDRNANVEVAYLLQQIEEYDGVCILATNLIGNIDAAFMRRITYVVRFPFPEADMREQIYRRTIPKDAPVDEDIDWAFLAEKFPLSGGHIKNIVLAAAFLAAEDGTPISMAHLLRAAVNEMKKNEIIVVREQLREYIDLLEDREESL